MKKQLQFTFLAFLSLTFLFQSCNDEELPKAPEKLGTLLIREYCDSSETIYTYSDDSVLLSTRYNTIKPWDIGVTVNYDYNENDQLIKKTSIADDNSYKYVDEFMYLNNNIDSVKSYAFYDASTDTAYVSTYKYEYSGGELYKSQQYSKNSESVYEKSSFYYILDWDNDGNLITETRYNDEDEVTSISYSYYDNYNNRYHSVPIGKYRFPGAWKNNLTKLEIVYSIGNTQLYMSSTYKYNALDYPTEENRYFGNEDLTVTYYFEYE